MQSSRSEEIWEGDFSVIDTAGYGEKLRVLPIGDEPLAF